MKSLQAFTKEIDDLDIAIAELDAQIDRNELLKNSCGILFCGHETDVEELARRIKATFDIPFIGCTALAMMNTNGYSESTICLHILTSDECEFKIGFTDPIAEPSDVDKIVDVYHKLHEGIEQKERVIIAYAPWWSNMSYEYVIGKIDEESGGVPIYGGIASDGWDFENLRVICNGMVSNTQAVMLLIFGDIRPIFSIGQSVSAMKEDKRTVTKADGATVYELEGSLMIDYIKELGLDSDKDFVLTDCMATPFVTTLKTDDGDEIDILRVLSSIDHKSGGCTFLGRVEEGSDICMVRIDKSNIIASIRQLFDDVISQINASKDYKYSTILCSSCAARYCLTVADKEAETRGYEGRLPEGVNLQGAYMYGELCPGIGKNYSGLYNELYNETFSVLAF